MVFSLTSQFAHDARSQKPKAYVTLIAFPPTTVVTQTRLIFMYMACLVSGHIVRLRHIQTILAVLNEFQIERANFRVFVCSLSVVSP